MLFLVAGLTGRQTASPLLRPRPGPRPPRPAPEETSHAVFAERAAREVHRRAPVARIRPHRVALHARDDEARHRGDGVLAVLDEGDVADRLLLRDGAVFLHQA